MKTHAEALPFVSEGALPAGHLPDGRPLFVRQDVGWVEIEDGNCGYLGSYHEKCLMTHALEAQPNREAILNAIRPFVMFYYGIKIP